MTVPEKLKSLDELAAIAAAARAKGQTVVFTNGCFDLLHRGHVHILRQAKAAGDLLIVASQQRPFGQIDQSAATADVAGNRPH